MRGLGDYNMNTVMVINRETRKVTWAVRRNNGRYHPALDSYYATEQEAVTETLRKLETTAPQTEGKQ